MAALALVRNTETNTETDTETETTFDFEAAVAEPADNVVRGLHKRSVQAGGVQHEMLKILEAAEIKAAEKGGPRAIEQSPIWARMFGVEVTGDDISRLSQWVEEHSPIRVKFDPITGLFDRVKFNNKAVNAAKTDPFAPRPWRLDVARKIMFTDYKKETRKAKAAPTLKRGIDAVIREAARMIDTDPTATLESIRAEIEKALIVELSERILKERESDKHEDWVDTYMAEQEARARKTA